MTEDNLIYEPEFVKAVEEARRAEALAYMLEYTTPEQRERYLVEIGALALKIRDLNDEVLGLFQQQPVRYNAQERAQVQWPDWPGPEDPMLGPRGPDSTHVIHDEAYSVGPSTVSEPDSSSQVTASEIYDSVRHIAETRYEYISDDGKAPSVPPPPKWHKVPNRVERRKQARKARRKQKR